MIVFIIKFQSCNLFLSHSDMKISSKFIDIENKLMEETIEQCDNRILDSLTTKYSEAASELSQ